MMTYHGQCNVLRQHPEGEQKWIEMMRDFRRIPLSTFETEADFQSFREDETPLEFMSDDNSSYTARSHWGETPCLFLYSKGFEFIFITY